MRYDKEDDMKLYQFLPIALAAVVFAAIMWALWDAGFFRSVGM